MAKIVVSGNFIFLMKNYNEKKKFFFSPDTDHLK